MRDEVVEMRIACDQEAGVVEGFEEEDMNNQDEEETVYGAETGVDPEDLEEGDTRTESDTMIDMEAMMIEATRTNTEEGVVADQEGGGEDLMGWKRSPREDMQKMRLLLSALRISEVGSLILI